MKRAGAFTDRETLFIGNRWVPTASKTWLEVIDPSTEEVITRVREATKHDVDDAVSAARLAFEDGHWPSMAPAERGAAINHVADAIDARIDEFVALSVIERGTPVATTPILLREASRYLRYFAQQAREFPFRVDRRRPDGGITRVVEEPAGVVAAIAPWNGPLLVAALKLGPALACGCTTILKPAPSTPLQSYLLAEIVADVGLPPGVVNVVAGGRAVGQYLVSHPGVDKISFTGSTLGGRQILSAVADRVARVTLELGGKSAAIVCDDADLDAHLDSLVAAGLRNTGQSCQALTRVLVSAERHDELVERLKKAYESIRLGSAHDPTTEMGPLALEAQRSRVEHYVASGVQEGARIVTGGGRPGSLDRGYFIEPTLFADVDNSMRIAQEEIFGPVVSVIRYETLNDAIRIANDSIYGLAGSVFTADVERGYQIARRVRTGTYTVNGAIFDTTVPFGGFKQSGLGREGGHEGMRPFLETKAIHMPLGV